ncbi:MULTISPECIES: hypothetical protein [unclassified Mesorhizobium]|uniref:hypothetical protein n=1 Tax=unclassified Mesorhizobium TaxID=325217 RepID=UPI00112DCFFD|nr:MULTISPECIES: hypothetical protein [unclassified Mesorhizobium]MBZ9739743.1 hypothetical protein [Mesorhizobium sp. CO1-1-4]MBZ9804993.1 hypothetical protein [Mesorhizobium sp. ES1-6]TPL88734.1 hypothetical protein FJ948_21275 [Mesorhizobium sp. B2-3-12]
MSDNASIVSAIAGIAIAMTSTQALASCKQGFCVSGRDEGSVHIVEFSTTYTNVDHFNVSSERIVGGQIELGKNETRFQVYIPRGKPPTFSYAIQACAYGGFPPRSNCKPWVTFTHTVK